MNKIKMETRDQWYKPNLLYNIHWRPHKEPETPKMIVETVQFNPSVCTCGQHDCQPRYRMEKRVLWSNKEMHSTKQKMEESEALAKFDKCRSKQNESEFDDKKNARKDKEEEHNSKTGVHVGNGKSCMDNCLTPDGNIKDDTNGGGENIGVDKFDSSRTGNGEKDKCGSGDENGESLKTDGQKHDSGLYAGGSNCNDIERTGDVVKGDDENDDNADGLKTYGIKNYGGLHIGRSNCDDIGRTCDGVKGKEVSNDENDEDDHSLKTDAISNDGGLKTEGKIVNGGAETIVSVSDIINEDGCDRATEDGDRYSDGISETIDDDRLENLSNEQENSEDYDDISPAFGILSIYCNSELHCMVSNSPTSNNT